ncbi:hypothetical protein A2456_00480 [Candidatus Nomurabacteria bacterium RIFOXYC2_FULL_36_19]|uniref:DUF3955 domain-containing protein n=2 Tax=Candidatus Nomuraibacteriota TaxID=1752729 RepID=A0A1F6YWB7_9BACT|nr:MAG: hypothetical protein A2238_00770 [Candidatus Nomurabacteria bacterium RIFOXYA2_FULL_35_9]OGJ06856.1 MAG: hypothetical protein A2192_01095 [Candidatus Nomurabacteria bacterium RIFOXYA1_FULL_35_17]OGJ10672.1 MAG: hypothetical protein A2456_00480 [Candidatus Nomurabacteria bacterium RIFOXYC2_FULL_36_19]OGJ14849.1 MAG: hypothetical protein A2554_00425 [Candidatus Nomurabacteria bacterium RIFOXYD2_FULL_35_12]
MKNFSFLRVVGILLIIFSVLVAIVFYLIFLSVGGLTDGVSEHPSFFSSIPFAIPFFMFVIGVFILIIKKYLK